MTTESDMKKPTLEDLAELCAKNAVMFAELSEASARFAEAAEVEIASLRERVRVLEEQVAGDGR